MKEGSVSLSASHLPFLLDFPLLVQPPILQPTSTAEQAGTEEGIRSESSAFQADFLLALISYEFRPPDQAVLVISHGSSGLQSVFTTVLCANAGGNS